MKWWRRKITICVLILIYGWLKYENDWWRNDMKDNKPEEEDGRDSMERRLNSSLENGHWMAWLIAKWRWLLVKWRKAVMVKLVQIKARPSLAQLPVVIEASQTEKNSYCYWLSQWQRKLLIARNYWWWFIIIVNDDCGNYYYCYY